MEPSLILLLGSITFFLVVSVLVYYDGLEPNGMFPYPFSYRFESGHFWCRRITKICWMIASILWFLTPLFQNIIDMQSYPVYVCISVIFFTYVIMIILWIFGQTIIAILCFIIIGFFESIWHKIKAFIHWLII